MSKTLLFYCPQMEALAQRIIEQDACDITLGSIDWSTFQDGFPDLFIEDVEAVVGSDIVFLASFDTSSEIFRQLAVLYALPWYGARSLKIFLPYFPTGTMDRVQEPGQVATAKTLTRQLSAIPSCVESKSEIYIFDIHALQEGHYFSDEVAVRLLTALPLLTEQLSADAVIAFPDEGAYKRFGRQLKDWPHIICRKVRDGSRRKVVIEEGDPRGRQTFIVDDLVHSGGTLLACREALVQAGARDVGVFVTHGVFPQDSWRKFIGSNFATVMMTDSCPLTVPRVIDTPPFRVVSLAPLIAQHITKGSER